MTLPDSQHPTSEDGLRRDPHVPHVGVDTEAGIATLTLHNPRRKNALTRPMRRQLISHLADLGARPDVSTIVLTGAGREFSAGMDIREIQPDELSEGEAEFLRVEEAIVRCPVPTIAAIEGHCVGAAMQLALACDLRLASRGSRFAITPAKLGLVYPAPAIARLVRVVGPSVARRLLFTAELIDARTAQRCGIVDDLAAPEDFAAMVRTLARTIASRSSVSVAAAKQMINAVVATGDVPKDLAARWATIENPDLPAGLQAFATRSEPVFPARTP